MSAALHINETPVVKLGNAMMGVPDGQTDIEGDKPAVKTGGIAQERLINIVERWERLDEEVKTLREDQKEIMAEAKSCGLDPKIVRKCIALRKKDPNEVEEEETLLTLYMRALGG